MSERENSRLKPILLVGCLSMLCAEVFAGSSRIWVIDPWSLLVTYWLYLGHLLFFLNLAILTKRTSVPQLYLWGVLFGLYESWITKVLWSGYPGSDGPIFGLVGGIAILEFIVLCFFWHPILAFVLPVLLFEALVLSKDSSGINENQIFPSHVPYLMKNSLTMKIFIIIVLLASAFLAVNSGFNILVAFIASISSVGIVFLLYHLSKQNSIDSLKLGKVGFIIVSLYLGLLYVVTWFILAPDKIPVSFIPIAIIIVIYAIIIVLLKLSKPINESEIRISEDENIIKDKDIFKLFTIFIVLSALYCLIPVLSFIIFLLFTLAILIIGPVLFVYFLKKALKGE